MRTAVADAIMIMSQSYFNNAIPITTFLHFYDANVLIHNVNVSMLIL